MQRLADVKKRIRAVTGIRDVCRTLSTVAAAKLSHTRERALGARAYAAALRTTVQRQQAAVRDEGGDPASLSKMLETREVRSVLVIVVGADKGLCGAYNVALGRQAREFLSLLDGQGTRVELAAKGTRVARYLSRTVDAQFAEVTEWTRAGVTDDEVDHYLELALDAFLCGRVDEVWACHTSFLSTVQREPAVVRLLPIACELPPEVTARHRWFYEPGRPPCVDELLNALVRTQVETVLLEAFASEQAARMVTMQEATERADRTLAELRVRFNRLRREAITSDLVGVLVAGRLRGGANRV